MNVRDFFRSSLGLQGAPGPVWPRGLSFASFPVYRTASSSGQTVTVDNALGLIPVFSAVSLLAGAIGSMPCKVFGDTGTDGPRREATNSRQWRLLHDQPNEEMAADEYWELVASHLLTWGNSFSWKQRDSNGIVQQLWPINPFRVQVGREEVGGGRTERVFYLDNGKMKVGSDAILHIRGLSSDGMVGYSPIQQARQRLGIEMARDDFAGSFWRNGTFAGAVLQHPNKLTKAAQARLERQIAERSGTMRAGEALILEEGIQWKELGMPLEDAQFVEQANLGRLEVALLYRVPPHMMGAAVPGTSLTYRNAEWEALDFVKWSLRRWLVRMESAVGRDPGIFPAPGPQLYPEFLMDSLLRGDTLTRWQAYEIGIRMGWINAEWVRQTDNIELPAGTTAEPVQNAAPPPPQNGNGNQPSAEQIAQDAIAQMSGR